MSIVPSPSLSSSNQDTVQCQGAAPVNCIFPTLSKDYCCVKVEIKYKGDRAQMHFYWEPLVEETTCPHCHGRLVIKDRNRMRVTKGDPIGTTETFHHFRTPVKRCTVCNRCITCVYGELAKHRRQMLDSMVEYIQTLLAHSEITPTALAKLLHIDERTASKYFKLKYASAVKPTSSSVIRHMAIDEVSIGSGHQYVTIFFNLETGEIIHLVRTNTTQAVIRGLQEIKEANPTITTTLEACAVDMNATFPKAIEAVFGDSCAIVYDLFHVQQALVKLINELALSTYRALPAHSQQRKDKRARAKELTGFITRKDKTYLSDKQIQRLNILLEEFPILKPLQDAVSTTNWVWKSDQKEEQEHALALLFDSLDCAEQHLIEQGYSEASKSYKQLIAFKKLLENHMDGILPAVLHKIGTSPLEAVNSFVKVTKRMSRGNLNVQLLAMRLKARFNKEFDNLEKDFLSAICSKNLGLQQETKNKLIA